MEKRLIMILDGLQVYSPDQAAQKAGVSIQTLYRWIKNKNLCPLRVGGRTYIPANELERFLSKTVLNEKRQVKDIKKERGSA